MSVGGWIWLVVICVSVTVAGGILGWHFAAIMENHARSKRGEYPTWMDK